ncbi:DUF1236 domain-containing protein [Microvirga sp. BT688]|nr:DUF1236 domain-containing protein [Microvirga sp.]
MENRILKPALAAIILVVPLAACQTGAGTGAAGGAITGAVLGGPVGAVVGGVAGAAAGAALTPDESVRVRQYVVARRAPSVRVRENVAVGYRLPRRVAYRPLPPELGLRREYGYTIVNDRPVLVEPRTREIVYIYD